MSRLERRFGTGQLTADSVASFKKSLDDAPDIGSPRIVLENATARSGEVLLADTNSSDKLIRLSPDMQLGRSARVTNYGPNKATVTCPPGSKFIDGSTINYVAIPYGTKAYVKVSGDRYAVLSESENYFAARDPASEDYDETDLTLDGTLNTLDMSDVLPVEAANQLVRLATWGKGTVSTPANARINIVIVDGDAVGTSAGIVGYYESGEFDALSGWVKCNADREIKYKLTNLANDFNIAVTGWMLT